MGCGCKGQTQTMHQIQSGPGGTFNMFGEVMVECVNCKSGGETLVGASSGKSYGTRRNGERFFINQSDLDAQPGKFRVA